MSLTFELRSEIRRRIDERRRELVARELPDDPWHGTTTGYRHRKCRCDKCRAAESASRLNRRKADREKDNAYTREYRARRRAQAREASGAWSASA